jgi:hypothetical protein
MNLQRIQIVNGGLIPFESVSITLDFREYLDAIDRGRHSKIDRVSLYLTRFEAEGVCSEIDFDSLDRRPLIGFAYPIRLKCTVDPIDTD